MTKVIIFLFLLLSPIYLAKNAVASLKINEIYPAPTTGEFEWVEVYNDGSETVNLSSYFLTDDNSKQIKFFSQNIDPLGYVIATSSSVLNNDGDTVYLKNNQGETLETVSYSEKFSSDKSFVNCPDGSGSWFILSEITKNVSNSTACLNLSPTSLPEDNLSPILSSFPSSNPTPLIYSNIYLSEVMVDPETGNNEWVEIYNDNSYQVSLDGWYIDDLENAGSTPKKFSLVIESKAYGIYELSTSIFNNDGDSVRLLDINQIEKDSFQYQSGEKGKSQGRINLESDTFCLQSPSKANVNNPCLNPTSSLNTSPTRSFPPSRTPTLSLSSIIRSNVKKPTGYFFTSEDDIESEDIVPEKNNVLGLTSKNKKITEPRIQAALSSLSLVSFSYAILTIASILFKMKMNL